MKRRPPPRSGPDSVWRILRRLAREARDHEEWLRRFEVEERARERAFRRRMRSEEAAWREQLAREEREREAKETAWRAKMEREKKERDAEEAARQAAYEAERKQAERRLDRAIHRMIGDGDERFGRLMEALTEGDLPPLCSGPDSPCTTTAS